MSVKAFQINPTDNVATLLDDVAAGAAVEVLGAASDEGRREARTAVARAHKMALRDIAAGGAVIKFGVRIGHATVAIRAGEWVHLHNLASDHDERSGTLELHSGAPTDTASSYV